MATHQADGQPVLAIGPVGRHEMFGAMKGHAVRCRETYTFALALMMVWPTARSNRQACDTPRYCTTFRELPDKGSVLAPILGAW